MRHHRKPSTCHLLAERGQPGKRLEQRTRAPLMLSVAATQASSAIDEWMSSCELIALQQASGSYLFVRGFQSF